MESPTILLGFFKLIGKLEEKCGGRKDDRRIFIRAQCNSDIFSLFSSFNFEPIKRHFPPLLTYFFPRSRKYLGAQLLNRVGVRRSRVSRWTNPLNFHAKCKYAIEREERSYVHISGDRLMEVAEEVLDYSGKNWFMNKFIYPKFRNKYGDRVIFETECGYNIND